MQVVKLDTPNLRDVPASLRLLADKIESGEVPTSVHAIVVSEDENGELDLYFYGSVGRVANEVGMLQMAVIKMAIAEGSE